MKVELIKRMMDACYLAKRARDMLPPLPEGVMPSYIQYLDALQKLEARGVLVRVSDLSEALGLPRPGVTRTVKEMEAKGYLHKQVSAEDGRVTYLSLTEAGKQLSRKYDADYFQELAPWMDRISEEDAECMIATIETFYQIMAERRTSFEK
jgi:DNA-binding MarR family transcriptional regulator